MKTYLVDVDGTVADNEHRQHWLRVKPKNWPAYNKTMADDVPIQHVIDVIWALKTAGFDIVFCSGREGSPFIRQTTRDWLVKHVTGPCSAFVDKEPILYMRDHQDYRDDSIIKLELLQQIKDAGYRPVAVFDDRKRVVDAWRSVGLPCYQVAPGDF